MSPDTRGTTDAPASGSQGRGSRGGSSVARRIASRECRPAPRRFVPCPGELRSHRPRICRRTTSTGPRRVAAARPRGLEPAPDVAKCDLVGSRQVVEEQPPYAFPVGQPGDFDLLLSSRRELGVQPAAVAAVRPPRDVTEIGEAVNKPGGAARTQQDALGDLGHSHRVGGRVVEADQQPYPDNVSP